MASQSRASGPSQQGTGSIVQPRPFAVPPQLQHVAFDSNRPAFATPDEYHHFQEGGQGPGFQPAGHPQEVLYTRFPVRLAFLGRLEWFAGSAIVSTGNCGVSLVTRARL